MKKSGAATKSRHSSRLSAGLRFGLAPFKGTHRSPVSNPSFSFLRALRHILWRRSRARQWFSARRPRIASLILQKPWHLPVSRGHRATRYLFPLKTEDCHGAGWEVIAERRRRAAERAFGRDYMLRVLERVLIIWIPRERDDFANICATRAFQCDSCGNRIPCAIRDLRGDFPG